MKFVMESIEDVLKPKKLGKKELKVLDVLKQMKSIIDDPNYPKYLDEDLLGDPQDIQKVGDIYSMSHLIPKGGRFQLIHEALGRWNNGDDPSRILKDLEIYIEEILSFDY